MLFYSNFSKKIELEGLSWAFIETHGGALLITITALIMTLFGTIYWLRKSDVIEN
jgi:hypothetical protein